MNDSFIHEKEDVLKGCYSIECSIKIFFHGLSFAFSEVNTGLPFRGRELLEIFAISISHGMKKIL